MDLYKDSNTAKMQCNIMVNGCNFHCGFCRSPNFHKPMLNLPWDKFESTLSEAKDQGLSHVSIRGGEPTTNPTELLKLIKELKKQNLDITLYTNGSMPHIISELEVDGISMDFKTSPERYNELTNLASIEEKILKSVEIIKNRNSNRFTFTTSLVPNLVGEDEIVQIGNHLKGSTSWKLLEVRNMDNLLPKFSSDPLYSPEDIHRFYHLAKSIVPGVTLEQ